MIHQLAQMAFAFTAIGRLVGTRGDKGADPAARLHHAAAFQLGINFGDRIRIDAQVDRQLPHRRQLVANAELAGSNRKANRPVELMINRRRMFRIDLEHDRFTHCTTTMGQVKVSGIAGRGGRGSSPTVREGSLGSMVEPSLTVGLLPRKPSSTAGYWPGREAGSGCRQKS